MTCPGCWTASPRCPIRVIPVECATLWWVFLPWPPARCWRGATSLPAVGEWITDAPLHVLERVGVRLDPLFPNQSLAAETTVRRLLARIDGDSLDLAVGRWLVDRRNRAEGRLCVLAVDGKSLRGAARARAARSTCSQPWTTPPAWSWHSWTCRKRVE